MATLLYWKKIIFGLITGMFTFLFGGADVILSILITLVIVDYCTGVLGGIYQGNLSSEIGYKGIVRKIGIFAVVALAHMLGVALGIAEVRSVTIGFYIANEGISILENCGKMGIPLPQKLIDVLQQLKDKE